jgi:hypothetical protein
MFALSYRENGLTHGVKNVKYPRRVDMGIRE